MRSRPAALLVAAVLLAGIVVVVAVGAPSDAIRLGENGPITFARSAGRDADLLTIDAAGGAVTVLVSGRGTVGTPAWSSDGRSLAYAWRDPTQGGFRIRVVDAPGGEGGDDRILTPGDAIDGSPTWSPSRDRIAYSSNRDGGRFGVFVMRADGSDPVRLADGQAPAWSPTGEWIAFVRSVDGQRDLFAIRPDGSGERRLTADPGDDIDPAWTPDGTAIVFASARAGAFDLYRVDPDSGAVTSLLSGPDDDRDPAVSPDGQLIAFSRIVEGGADLWLTDGNGMTRQLTDDRLSDAGPAWQPLGVSPSE